MRKLCKCGCGDLAKPENIYLNGHCNRGKKVITEEGKLKISQTHKNKTISKETRLKISKSNKGKIPWNKGISPSEITRRKIGNSNKGIPAWNKGKTAKKSSKIKMSISSKLTIEKIKERYPFFSKIEGMRYNPDKPEEKEIQVHCKNHNCKNSKEQSGWFTPTYNQLYGRRIALENPHGMIEMNFYCSQECKNICPLYGLYRDPYEKPNIESQYTQGEYKVFREFVLNRDNYECQFCGETATDVHHERPQKLEPFFALDPDFGWSCCEKCHYEKGHSEECSTGKLSHILCKGV